MKRKLAVGAGLAGVGVLALAGPAAAQDAEPAFSITQATLDNFWLILAGVLVFFMQAGFALVEAGLTRAKNVANIMAKNLMDMAAGVLAFAAIGYSIAYGPDGNDFFGLGNWFLGDIDAGFGPESGSAFAGFFFQAAFAAAAATIVSGAMAERTKFKSYFIYSLAITAVIYPVVVRWSWGGGWLAQLDTPFSDFAGSTIVHSVGGWAALMGALILGPRIGKYGKDGKPRAIPGHSIPFVAIGGIILFIGWFGFNAGSELALDDAIPLIALNTLLAACAGAVTAMMTIWAKSGKPDVAMAVNGLLAGLVSITAGCGSFTPFFATVAGGIGGVLVVFSVLFFDNVAKIDDPVGAISVHGVCGAWGTLAIGLFAFQDDAFLGRDKAGLIYGGGFDQLITQAIMVVSVFVFVTVTAGALFYLIKVTVGLRVDEEEEVAGLDVMEHGAPGYAPDSFSGGSGMSSSASTPVGAGL